ncbi:hypothetical protein MO973_43735 [Paenibacillus sp. TRM 82003]|nr:hypothetical protein [Paenibacillus sp. TRM 82003]
MTAVIVYFAKFDQSLARTALEMPIPPMEAVSFFIERLAEYYEGYPAISSVMTAYDTLKHDLTATELLDNIYRFRLKTVEDLLLRAKETGLLRDEADPGLLSSVIWSAFTSLSYEWRSQNCGFLLRNKTVSTISMLLTLATKG